MKFNMYSETKLLIVISISVLHKLILLFRHNFMTDEYTLHLTSVKIDHPKSASLETKFYFKDVRVHAPITYIKLGIPVYFIDHSEFITVQCKKILSRANNEIKCFEFSSIKRALKPHLRTIIAI